MKMPWDKNDAGLKRGADKFGTAASKAKEQNREIRARLNDGERVNAEGDHVAFYSESDDKTLTKCDGKTVPTKNPSHGKYTCGKCGAECNASRMKNDGGAGAAMSGGSGSAGAGVDSSATGYEQAEKTTTDDGKLKENGNADWDKNAKDADALQRQIEALLAKKDDASFKQAKELMKQKQALMDKLYTTKSLGNASDENFVSRCAACNSLSDKPWSGKCGNCLANYDGEENGEPKEKSNDIPPPQGEPWDQQSYDIADKKKGQAGDAGERVNSDRNETIAAAEKHCANCEICNKAMKDRQPDSMCATGKKLLAACPHENADEGGLRKPIAEDAGKTGESIRGRENARGCDQCDMLSINGHPTHETGCPNAWKQQQECKECGQKFTPEERGQICCDEACSRAYSGLPFDESENASLQNSVPGDVGYQDKCDACKKPVGSDALHTVKASDGTHTRELCGPCREKKNSLENAGHLAAEPWAEATEDERMGWLISAAQDADLARLPWVDLSMDAQKALQDAWDMPASRNLPGGDEEGVDGRGQTVPVEERVNAKGDACPSCGSKETFEFEGAHGDNMSCSICDRTWDATRKNASDTGLCYDCSHPGTAHNPTCEGEGGKPCSLNCKHFVKRDSDGSRENASSQVCKCGHRLLHHEMDGNKNGKCDDCDCSQYEGVAQPLPKKENAISESQWEEMARAYEKIGGIDPTSPTGEKFLATIHSADDDTIRQLAAREIKFVSKIARNEMSRRGLKNAVDNWNCDGSGPHTAGEVRRLPTDKNGSSVVILCRSCFDKEMQWRKERNQSLEKSSQFPILSWGSVPVYKNAMSETRNAYGKNDAGESHYEFAQKQKLSRQCGANDMILAGPGGLQCGNCLWAQSADRSAERKNAGSSPVCPNCGQWQSPTQADGGFWDCFQECAKRGFAQKKPSKGWNHEKNEDQHSATERAKGRQNSDASHRPNPPRSKNPRVCPSCNEDQEMVKQRGGVEHQPGNCPMKGEKQNAKKWTPKCPKCKQDVWDVAFGSKLHKCHGCGTAFDTESAANYDQSPAFQEEAEYEDGRKNAITGDELMLKLKGRRNAGVAAGEVKYGSRENASPLGGSVCTDCDRGELRLIVGEDHRYKCDVCKATFRDDVKPSKKG